MNGAEDFVTLVEVGPRDGLQNEKRVLDTATRVELIHRLSACGIPVVETGSFVSPKWVPQMANTDSVVKLLRPTAGTRYPALVPNMAGMERALSCGVKEISLFTAASETFCKRNINCSVADSVKRFEPVIQAAKKSGIKVRGYISCVLGCPYEGLVEESTVARLCETLVLQGCDEISLGDTIGVGTPGVANALVRTVSSAVPIEILAVHFHDTYGQALANILACLDEGVRIVDAAVAGLGGCPYANGASGNVASEDVVYMLHGLGLTTGIDLHALAKTGAWISEQLQRSNNSKTGLALTTSS